MWGFLGLIYLAWQSRESKEKEKTNREIVSMKYRKSDKDVNANHEYDLLEARIKKYSEKHPKHAQMDRCYLLTLITARKEGTPLSEKKDWFWIYKNEEISDEELEDFCNIRDIWEKEFMGKTEED